VKPRLKPVSVALRLDEEQDRYIVNSANSPAQHEFSVTTAQMVAFI